MKGIIAAGVTAAAAMPISGRMNNQPPEPQDFKMRRSGSEPIEPLPVPAEFADYSELEARILAQVADANGVSYEQMARSYDQIRSDPLAFEEFYGVPMQTPAPRAFVCDVEIPTIPDHVSIDPASRHFWSNYKLLGVRIDGKERPGDVHEFCVSEGWAMVRQRGPNNKFAIDPENGQNYLLERIQGKIEPYYRKAPEPPRGSTSADADRLRAAEEKRARKAAKLKG